MTAGPSPARNRAVLWVHPPLNDAGCQPPHKMYTPRGPRRRGSMTRCGMYNSDKDMMTTVCPSSYLNCYYYGKGQPVLQAFSTRWDRPTARVRLHFVGDPARRPCDLGSQRLFRANEKGRARTHDLRRAPAHPPRRASVPARPAKPPEPTKFSRTRPPPPPGAGVLHARPDPGRQAGTCSPAALGWVGLASGFRLFDAPSIRPHVAWASCP